MDTYVIIVLFLELALAFFLLWREKLINTPRNLLFPALFLMLAMALRVAQLQYESNDYLSFLAPWTEFLRENGFKGLGCDLGNYNPPYMYLLWFFSLFPAKELCLIKLTSIAFDILLAYSALKLMSLCTENRLKLLVCFFSILLLPTFIINGAMWGQCDSIYCFFGIFSVYLALAGRPWQAMVCIAASLAFKLQAVFIMPVFAVLLIQKKLKLVHFLAFPAAYIIYMLPAVIAGRPLLKVLTLYVSNADTVGSALNYNSPSLTSMLSSVNEPEQISKLLILASFVFMLSVLLFAFIRKTELNTALTVGFTALLVVGIPYLLPHMHDRYFYLAGVLSVVLACYNPKYFAMPLLAELASLHCYAAYFTGHYTVHPRYGGIAMLVVLLMVIVFVVTCKRTDEGIFAEKQ